MKNNMTEINSLQLMEWFDNIERKPSEIAFTEGLNRTVAYLMEYAEKRADKKIGGIT